MKDRLYSGFVIVLLLISYTIPPSFGDTVLSPLAQLRQGVALDKIVCADGLELIMKKSDGKPACVKPQTASILIERGWGEHVLPSIVEDEERNSKIFERGSFETTGQTVSYFEDAVGFLARPAEQGNFPGVIMIHEWWGLNDNIKEMASSLASHGYVVLAADLYAGQVATTPEGARQLVTTFDSQKGIENLGSAAQFLRDEGVEKLATIGWCFGGTQSFSYALSGDNLDATVIYYGRVSSNVTELAKIEWPVLGIFGELDTGIPKESVMGFESALDELGIQNEIYIYPGVDHAFTNPSGAAYAPEETKDAWQKTVSFLDEYLRL